VEKDPTAQLLQYLPILMLLAVAIVLVASMLILSTLLGKKGKRPPIKDTAYECGMLPVGVGTPAMVVRFYLVAMLFILFDIEVVFLYPWAVSFRQLGLSGFVTMVVFIFVLFLGYFYVWRKGALELD
jgi:NADH-quinone oxidoreductase subunit A